MVDFSGGKKEKKKGHSRRSIAPSSSETGGERSKSAAVCSLAEGKDSRKTTSRIFLSARRRKREASSTTSEKNEINFCLRATREKKGEKGSAKTQALPRRGKGKRKCRPALPIIPGAEEKKIFTRWSIFPSAGGGKEKGNSTASSFTSLRPMPRRRESSPSVAGNGREGKKGKERGDTLRPKWSYVSYCNYIETSIRRRGEATNKGYFIGRDVLWRRGKREKRRGARRQWHCYAFLFDVTR